MGRPPKIRRKKFDRQTLTKHLRALAEEVETLDDEGNALTRAEVLAAVLWKKALGYSTRSKDGTEVVHKPESWAIQLIYERLEGKAPLATPEEKGRITAAEKVGELARNKLNDAAKAVVAVPGAAGPVDRSGDGSQSPQGPHSQPGVENPASD